MRYPSYNIDMPEMVKEQCGSCYGKGIKIVIAGNLDVVYDGDCKIEYRFVE